MSLETNRIFEKIMAPYELDELGMREYCTLTPKQVAAHQRQLDDFLSDTATFGATGAGDFSDDDVRKLNRRAQDIFYELAMLDVDDEVIAWGRGATLIVLDGNAYDVQLLAEEVRIHGQIVRPVALPAPRLDSIVIDGESGEIDFDGITEQLAFVLELELVSVESYGYYESPPDGALVYLPLCYDQMKIKKRITDS